MYISWLLPPLERLSVLLSWHTLILCFCWHYLFLVLSSLFFFIRWSTYYRNHSVTIYYPFPRFTFSACSYISFFSSHWGTLFLPSTNLVHHPASDNVGEFVSETPVHPLLRSCLLLISFLLSFARVCIPLKILIPSIISLAIIGYCYLFMSLCLLYLLYLFLTLLMRCLLCMPIVLRNWFPNLQYTPLLVTSGYILLRLARIVRLINWKLD